MHVFRTTVTETEAEPEALAPRHADLVSRLRHDLLLGLPVVLQGDDGACAMVALIEAQSDDRLAAFRALGDPELLLTARRAVALGLEGDPKPELSGILRVRLPQTAGASWLRMIAGQGAELSSGPPAGLALLEPATEVHSAAVGLAKSAQRLPAFVVIANQSVPEEAARLGLSSMRAKDVLATLARESAPQRVSSAGLPMEVAETGKVHVFRPDDQSVEHYAIEIGTPDLTGPITVRLHSACFTGDVLGSRKCDCGPQLRGAMRAMAKGGGVLLYLNQEGRGIGLANKMRAYRLQEAGLDTVEANHWLGFEDDERDFRTGGQMLKRLGITRVRLMTNNPAKIAILASQGIDVVERVPLHTGCTPQNAGYLATKAAKSGHLLP